MGLRTLGGDLLSDQNPTPSWSGGHWDPVAAIQGLAAFAEGGALWDLCFVWGSLSPTPPRLKTLVFN